ncbi:MAG: serine/threonine protein kinase, partial [Candidatus Xenobia bacterium]
HGVCSVFRAEPGPVAIKTYLDLNLASEEMRERFRREIEIGLAVRHPNLCGCLDWGYSKNRIPYLVMELLEGQPLLDAVGPELPPWQQARPLMVQTLQAADALHQAGIVHRNLKPDNLFLTREGVLKILDFGLSRKFGMRKITSEGTTLGTITYISPEQMFNAAGVDARADLFTLGVVFYQLMAGRVPIQGNSLGEVVTCLASLSYPLLSSARPDLPGGVSAWVQALMAGDVRQRPVSARVALDTLPA